MAKMEVRIHAEGPGFKSSSDLKSVLSILDGYGDSFDFCLKRSAATFKIAPDIPVPRVGFVRAQPGTLTIQLITEIASVIAPLAPDIFGYAWTLYKAGYDLVGLAVNYFRKEQRPIQINIKDSPMAFVTVVGDQVNTTKDVLETILKGNKNFDRIATLVKENIAGLITIEPGNPDLPHPIVFDGRNKNDFKVQTFSEMEETPIELLCSIIRFHKKTMNGSLEILDDELGQTYSFTIDPSIYKDCIEAFREDTVTVTAYRDFEVTALGERKVKSFRLVGIAGDKNNRPG